MTVMTVAFMFCKEINGFSRQEFINQKDCIQIERSRKLNTLHLVTVVQADVHHVVEDHEEADVVGEEEDVADDARDYTKEGGHLVSLSEEREDLEDNGHHEQQDVEDDVGIDEVLPVLPDPVDGETEEDQPDEGHDEGQDEDGHEVRKGVTDTPDDGCRVNIGLVWNPSEFS